MAHPLHQSMIKGGLRPLFKWLRFFGYFAVILLFYHLYIGFQPLGNISQQQHIGDFPWYKTAHARTTITGSISTSHLTSMERSQLKLDLIDRAHKRSTLAFNKLSLANVIPGTNLRSATSVRNARAQIDCWTRGRWVPESRDQLTHHKQDPLYGTCDKRHHTTLRPETQYRWQPSGECGRLPTPTPQQWCKVLKGRHILLVGDMVQYQLHELFLDSLRDGSTVCFGELNCKDHTICTEMDTRLRYLRNDVLADNRKQLFNDEGIVTWPFVPRNVLSHYPILILNRSPILEDDDTFISSMISTLTYIRRTMPDILIIYRSSPMGHPYCDDAETPLTTPLTDDEKRRLPFGWAELDRRNAMGRAIIEAAGGIYVDLAAVVETRPEGHIGGHDCLRYCIPGPLDAWLDILYQVFAVLDTDEWSSSPPP